jgi:O-antigen/teichoic acid export membrane protein
LNESKSFVKDSLITLVRQFLGILIGLLTTIILARYLGPEGQGMYALIILLPTILVTFLNFGVGVSSVYFVGKKEFSINTVFKTNLYFGLGLSLVSFIIGSIVILIFPENFFNSIPSEDLFTVLLIIPFMFLNQFLQAIFQGNQDFDSFNLILLFGQISLLLSSVFFLIFLDLHLLGSILSYILSQVITLSTIFYLTKKRLGIAIKNSKFSCEYLRKSILYGIKAYVSNVIAFLIYRIDIFLISFFVNPVGVGIYVLAVNIAERLWIISQAVATVLFPRISSLVNDDEKNEITSIVNRNIFALSIISGIVVYFISEPLIYLLFGIEYLDSSKVLKFLLPGIVLFTISRILSNDIAGRGKPEINTYISIFTALSNIIMNIMLIPVYGVNGAAIATSISYSLDAAIRIIYFKKLTKQYYHYIIFIQKNDIRFYLKLVVNVGLKLRKVVKKCTF